MVLIYGTRPCSEYTRHLEKEARNAANAEKKVSKAKDSLDKAIKERYDATVAADATQVEETSVEENEEMPSGRTDEKRTSRLSGISSGFSSALHAVTRAKDATHLDEEVNSKEKELSKSIREYLQTLNVKDESQLAGNRAFSR